MKWALVLCFLFLAFKVFSQDKTIDGIVFDNDTKDRMAIVSVHNITTGIAIYDNLKGEFKINANIGDRLVFSKADYLADTVKVQAQVPLAIYMQRKAIQLREVTVRDSAWTPEKQLAAIKEQYSKVYGSLAYNDFLTSPSSGSAGLSIDALWNSISKSGRDAERLRNTIERDYEQNSIDYRFNRNYVGNITGLKDEKLTAFMARYRPGYYTTKTATEYEFVAMIRANLRRFVRSRNQRTYILPELITPPVTNN